MDISNIKLNSKLNSLKTLYKMSEDHYPTIILIHTQNNGVN